MNPDTRDKLNQLAATQGKEYGKLVQKLLAIAFCEAGATRVAERSIQGIDLEVVLSDAKVALEVKTVQSDKVRFGKKDIDGLDARRAEGFVPYFAILGPGLLDEWVFAHCLPAEIQAQRDYSINQLRAYRDTTLEAAVSVTFPAAVSKHSAAAAQGGQKALNQVLQEFPCFSVA